MGMEGHDFCRAFFRVVKSGWRNMKKPLIITAIAIVGLVFAARVAVRPVVHAIIEKRVGAGVEFSLGRVRVNPFAGSIIARNIVVRAQNDDPARRAGLVFLSAKIDNISYRRDTILIGGASVDLVPAELPGNSTRIEVTGLTTTAISLSALHNGSLRIDSVAIDSIRIISGKNRKIDSPPTVKPMLWEQVRSIPLSLDVPMIGFKDLFIQYSERSTTSTEPGVVTLGGGGGTITGLTNIVEGRDRFFSVDLSTHLMGDGLTTIRSRFPISPDDDHWELWGTLGRTDLTSLNPALEPLMGAHVAAGTVQGMDFRITGTRAASHVEMTMRYSGLEMEMRRRSDHKREELLTFALDEILIHHDNPGADGVLRTGSGDHIHDPHRSMYNFIWRSFVPGLRQTVL